MFRNRRVINRILLLCTLIQALFGSENQCIYSICRNTQDSFNDENQCIIKKQPTNMAPKYIKFNKECACLQNILEMFNQSINDNSSSAVISCSEEQQFQNINPVTERLKYPQEECQLSHECLSGKCNQINGKCEGQQLGEKCNSFEGNFCNPELYCDQESKICDKINKFNTNSPQQQQNIKQKGGQDYSNKVEINECSTSYQCQQNEFCHYGRCQYLMSLGEGEEIDKSENTLYRIGNSLIDIRCKSLFAQDNKCSQTQNQNDVELKLQKCTQSDQCPQNRKCNCVWDSSVQFFNSNKYNPFSNSYCQIYPNNQKFIQSVKDLFISKLLKQNELCPINIKLQSKCDLINKELKNLQDLIYYLDNYHIIKNTCFNDLIKQFNPQIINFIDQYYNQDKEQPKQQEQLSQQYHHNRELEASSDPSGSGHTTQQGSSDSETGANTSGGENNPTTNEPKEGDTTNNPNTNQPKGDETKNPSDNSGNNTNNNNNGNDQNNNTKPEDKKDQPSESESSGSSTVIIVLLVIVLLVFGCCGAVIYIRRRNENGFASLTANLENDKKLMLGKTGGMMSMGSSSINNNNKANANSSDSSGNIQGKQKHSDEMQIVEQKKFSKRVVNEDSRLPSQQKEGTIPLKIQNHHSGVELQLEQNNGVEYSEKTPSTKLTNNRLTNHLNGNNNNTNSGNPSQQHQGQKSQNHKAQGNSSSQQRQNPTQQQDMEQQKNLDTSVQNNFFSIDGEDEEKHDKIMDSIQLDYQSDDTTYSNVFNLEGEESSKPHSNRKKKKKQKQQNHLFFDDKNEE